MYEIPYLEASLLTPVPRSALYQAIKRDVADLGVFSQSMTGGITEIGNDVRAAATHISEAKVAQGHQDTFRWLSSLRLVSKQTDALDGHQKRTEKWLLGSEQIR